MKLEFYLSIFAISEIWFLIYIVIHKPTQKITAWNVKLHGTFLILLISSTVKRFTECSTKLANSWQFAKHLQDIAEIRDLITRKRQVYTLRCARTGPRAFCPRWKCRLVPRQWALYGTWQSGRGVLQWLMLTASYPSSELLPSTLSLAGNRCTPY